MCLLCITRLPVPQAVRDQIRRLVVGGPQTVEEKLRVIEVSDSEDDDIDFDAAVAAAVAEMGAAAKGEVKREEHPPEETEAVCSSLRNNFVFRGIPEDLLREVRMIWV